MFRTAVRIVTAWDTVFLRVLSAKASRLALAHPNRSEVPSNGLIARNNECCGDGVVCMRISCHETAVLNS